LKNKFDFNTIDNFDDHINKSIPNYDLLIKAIKNISDYFYVKNTNIYDLGCSTGKLLKELSYSDCQKIGIDNSSLLPKQNYDNLKFINLDLNQDFKIENCSILYSIFTMQFLNPKNKYNYIKNIYDGLNIDGAMILCEKIYFEDGKIQEINLFSHWEHKLNNFTSDEIINKQFDLKLIMKCMLEKDLLNLLKEVGFNKIYSFWQIYNFKGYIVIK